MIICCYCGKHIDLQTDPDWFSWAGIHFHGKCRKEAIDNAAKDARKDVEEARVKRGG